MQIKTIAARAFRDTAGATAVEYSLIAMLIAVGAIVALQAVGGEVESIWSEVARQTAN